MMEPVPFDRSAAYGMPAHITVLYPFLPEPLLTGAVLERLRRDSGVQPVAEIRFERMRVFRNQWGSSHVAR
jgi:hypothetical protein